MGVNGRPSHHDDAETTIALHEHRLGQLEDRVERAESAIARCQEALVAAAQSFTAALNAATTKVDVLEAQLRTVVRLVLIAGALIATGVPALWWLFQALSHH